MRILIDADGCPVTGIAAEIAKEYNAEVIIFCDTSHIFDYDNVKVITVGKGADSADFALVNNIKENDLVITQDYGLSAMVLSRKGIVLNQNGLVINDMNIDTLLATRHISKKARMSGKHLKGPAKRTQQQNIRFEKALRGILDENFNSTRQL
ncbi:MAG: DUF188 domain-containing protein [Eubacterium sp.]|nr:DUF188 domain-containing protein [Eubacterium sp.]MDE6155860.1 DUF188 domain-containing protein [Eubacterium sp.]